MLPLIFFRFNYFKISFIFILLLGIILRLITFCSNSFIVSPDECHSIYYMKENIFTLLSTFYQGANFLPGYTLILKIIHSFFGFNFAFFKLISLIASIISLLVFWDLIKKIFSSKVILLLVFATFAINYNLILYSAIIKPYILDTLFTLIIINYSLYLRNINFNQLSRNKIILILLLSIFMVFTSIPAIVVLEICIFLLLLEAFLKKNKSNTLFLIFFQFIILAFLSVELYTYISQIYFDDSLKSQWTDSKFYFAPTSLKALNALIN